MNAFSEFLKVLKKKYPNYLQLWEKSKNEFGKKWEQELSKNIELMFGSKKNRRWNLAIDGYAEFCTEALRSQIYFEKTGRYEATNYMQVRKLCYFSEDYMNKRYLPGQYLSHYVWPHHQRMLRGFRKMVKKIFTQPMENFCEVGVGCGMYSKTVLEDFPKIWGVGYDISPFALKFTKKVVSRFGFGKRYKTKNINILKSTKEPQFDLVICQEVLEHLENPKEFIRGLYNLTKPGGYAYITAAINAGHTDHIYLYKSPNEVKEHILANSWSITGSQIESNYENKPIHQRPTIAGFFVNKPRINRASSRS